MPMVVFYTSICALPPDQKDLEEALTFYLREGKLKKGTAKRTRFLKHLQAFRLGEKRTEDERKEPSKSKKKVRKLKSH